MSIFNVFGKIWSWIKGTGHTIAVDAAPIVVAFFNGIKILLGNGELGFIAQIIDGLTHSNLPTEVVVALQKATPIILAEALGIEKLAADPTPDQLKAFEESLLTAFGLIPDKSKFYSTVSADIYGVVQSFVQPGVKLTWASFVEAVDAAFKKYEADLAAAQADTSDTDQDEAAE